jgi:hypothetical protein
VEKLDIGQDKEEKKAEETKMSVSPPLFDTPTGVPF